MNSTIIDICAYENAIKRNIIANAFKTFTKRDRASEVIEWASSHSHRSEFANSIQHSLMSYGKLTDKQFDAVLRCIEKEKAKKAEWDEKKAAQAAKSNHVGEVGKRINLSLTVVNIIHIETFYGSASIYLLDDTDGNRFVYKGTTFLGEKGQTVVFSANVKEHAFYEGGKQTVLARPTKVVVG